MIRKLQKRGDVSDVRIADLEKSLQTRVGGSIASQVKERITYLEKMLEENLKQEVKKKSGAWIVPFILLAVCLVFVFAYAYVPMDAGFLCIETIQASAEDSYVINVGCFACLLETRSKTKWIVATRNYAVWSGFSGSAGSAGFSDSTVSFTCSCVDSVDSVDSVDPFSSTPRIISM